jgi:aryl-alcohol dehydrogenase-like predicted oxidoreductase
MIPSPAGQERISGYATPQGTARFKDRFQGKLDAGHFRQKADLWFSSIGIGSYLGEPDAAADKGYEASLKEAVRHGVNVVDAAINYRAQRSERSFGKALAELIQAGEVQRDEIMVCTKGGFIPFDGEYPADAGAYFQKTYIEPGILSPEDVAAGCHAMTPKYLEDQLQRSLKNLGLETIDIYYLHNPETQLGEVDRREFLNRTRAAFEWLEKKVQEGKIRMYGTATWNGYRAAQDAKDYLSLEELNCIAREIGGAGHHFKAVQLPVNLAMPEAWIFPNQSLAANQVPFLAVAARNNLIVIGSAALLQARLAGPLPEFLNPYFKALPKSAQRSIQFARSLPGMTTALVGMKNPAHVPENLETAKVPPLSEQDLILMFQQAK